MSLEKSINELNKNIVALLAIFNKDHLALEAEAVKTEVVETVVAAKEVIEETHDIKFETPVPTHDDIKALCLSIARGGKKSEVKAVLTAYNAKKVLDLKSSILATVKSELEAL